MRTMRLADSNFAVTLTDVEERETEEAEAADEDGNKGKERAYSGQAFVILIETVYLILEGMVEEGLCAKILLLRFTQEVYHLLSFTRFWPESIGCSYI